MRNSRFVKIYGLLTVAAVGYALLLGLPGWTQTESESEPAPPADQEYIGARQCASCHFNQYLQWRKTKHAKTFELLPQQYQSNEKCLQCHTTGHGEETGYQGPQDTNLKGTSCESCHGPGSKHAELTKGFGDQLTPEQEKIGRDSIWKMLPKNVCVECHRVQAHHESETPPELRRD